MQEADTDSGFTTGGVTRRGNTGFGVLGDIAVEFFQVIECLIGAPQLVKCRQRSVSRTGALRVSNLDFAFVFRLGQIFSAGRDWQSFLFQTIFVHTET